METHIWVPPRERFGFTMSAMPYTATDRTMYDATGINSDILVPKHPMMVMGYDTGSSEIRWTQTDWARFPYAAHVEVDQGGPGAPVHKATVMDIEPGAYRPPDVPGWMAACTAERPTAYVDRNDCAAILADGYKGDIGLAWPGWAGEPLPGAPGQVVFVQDVFLGSYDISRVLDPWWPGKKPAGGKEMISGILHPGEKDYVPFPAGTFKSVMLLCDFNATGAPVRIAVYSQSHGYSQILDPYTVPGSIPVTIRFTEPDAEGISLVNDQGSQNIGWSLW